MALAPLYSRTASPATALVPLRLTRTNTSVSSVLPPLLIAPVTPPTLSVTLVILGAFGAVVSSTKVCVAAVLTVPAILAIVALIELLPFKFRLNVPVVGVAV